jgi:hypothetical protein
VQKAKEHGEERPGFGRPRSGRESACGPAGAGLTITLIRM